MRRGVRTEALAREATAGVSEERCRAATSGADEQILVPIAVDVRPGDAGAKLAEPHREQRLPVRVLEKRVHVAVAKQVRQVLEQRSLGLAGEPRVGGDGRCRLVRLADLVQPVGACVGDYAAAAARPANLDLMRA